MATPWWMPVTVGQHPATAWQRRGNQRIGYGRIHRPVDVRHQPKGRRGGRLAV
jgi:hypothetical protein